MSPNAMVSRMQWCIVKIQYNDSKSFVVFKIEYSVLYILMVKDRTSYKDCLILNDVTFYLERNLMRSELAI